MLRIKKLAFSRLSNEQHYGFMLGVQRLFEAFPDVKALVPHVILLFGTLLELEHKLLDAARASYLTRQLAEADNRVDRCVIAIKAAIRSALLHPDLAIAQAAQQLTLRLKNLGDIVHKSYEAETATVQVLLSELTTTFAPQASLVGLEPWVAKLAEAEQAFITLYEQRIIESAERPKERMADVRLGIQDEFGKVVTCVEGDIINNGEAKFGEFVNLLNELVKSFGISSRRTAKAATKQVTTNN
jgi:hypothetical protein